MADNRITMKFDPAIHTRLREVQRHLSARLHKDLSISATVDELLRPIEQQLGITPPATSNKEK